MLNYVQPAVTYNMLKPKEIHLQLNVQTVAGYKSKAKRTGKEFSRVTHFSESMRSFGSAFFVPTPHLSSPGMWITYFTLLPFQTRPNIQ
jgi:hypothetical protein